MSVTTSTTPDVVNAILGTGVNGRIAELRNNKPELIDQFQAYYLSIFEPDAVSEAVFSLANRAIIAIRVASHTRSTAVVQWYSSVAAAAGVDHATINRAKDLSDSWSGGDLLGASIQRADQVTLRPATTEASDLQVLKDAGLSPAGILSLSQVIAFVSYQLRLIAGLRVFGAAS